MAAGSSVQGRGDDPGKAADHLARVPLLESVHMCMAVEDGNDGGSRPKEGADLYKHGVESNGFDAGVINTSLG
jgi:hypothetical protein